MEVFFSKEGVVSAEELWLETRNQDPDIAVSTVYRALRLLADAGLARICEGQGAVHYEPLGKAPRDRLVCIDCGKVIDLELPEADLLQERISMRQGFTVDHREFTMYGRCPVCNKKRILAKRGGC